MKIGRYSSKVNNINIPVMRKSLKLSVLVDIWMKTLGLDRVIGENIFPRVFAFKM
jgi:hypothetical protein